MTPSEKRFLATLGKLESFWDLEHRVQSHRFQNFMKKIKVSDAFKENLELLLDTKHDEMRARREERAALWNQDRDQPWEPEIL
jgi:GTPase SAR1 family protein